MSSIRVSTEMKGISLSGSVHALVLITQIHVQTGDCSPLNPCDELLSDGTGIIISTVFTALAKPTGWQHDFNMNNTAWTHMAPLHRHILLDTLVLMFLLGTENVSCISQRG